MTGVFSSWAATERNSSRTWTARRASRYSRALSTASAGPAGQLLGQRQVRPGRTGGPSSTRTATAPRASRRERAAARRSRSASRASASSRGVRRPGRSSRGSRLEMLGVSTGSPGAHRRRHAAARRDRAGPVTIQGAPPGPLASPRRVPSPPDGSRRPRPGRRPSTGRQASGTASRATCSSVASYSSDVARAALASARKAAR